VYQNPHTGELIETKGGNHRGLKAWKEQYGVDTVDSWLRAWSQLCARRPCTRRAFY
ncbi:DNA binding protein, partial [Pseudomonas viridiflava]|uniref:DNA binding protein n=1 Tax=Pseudomonas viridiflava TaxID=33069 RepID=UPI0013E075ED